jgi:hypothetical protein
MTPAYHEVAIIPIYLAMWHVSDHVKTVVYVSMAKYIAMYVSTYSNASS